MVSIRNSKKRRARSKVQEGRQSGERKKKRSSRKRSSRTIQLNPVELIKGQGTKKRGQDILVPLAKGVLVGSTLFIGGAALGAARLGALGLGAVKGLFGTPKRALLTATGIGILQTSPVARQFVASKLRDPTSGGREIGKLIEDPSKLLPREKQTIRERAGQIAGQAGLIAGGAALAAGLVAAIKGLKGSQQVPSLLPTQVPAQLPSARLPTALLPAPPSISTRAQPLGAVQKIVEPVQKMPQEEKVMPEINITNRPQTNIDIRFSKSKKFINQQVLLKP